MRPKFLHCHFTVFFQNIWSCHLYFVSSHKYALVFQSSKTYQNTHHFIDFDTFDFFVHIKEIIEKVSQLFESFISFPNIALENNKRMNIDWNTWLWNRFDSFIRLQAQFDHIKNFIFVGSANDDVIGSFFIMWTEKEKWWLSWFTIFFDFLDIFKWMDFMFTIVNDWLVFSKRFLC